MNIKIEPRKATDRGGYLAMPLYENVSQPKDPAWKLTVCQECGQKCWERPLPEGFHRDMFSGQLCTRCAIRKGGQG